MPSGAVQNFTPVNPKEHWVYTRSTPHKKEVDFQNEIRQQFFVIEPWPRTFIFNQNVWAAGGSWRPSCGGGGRVIKIMGEGHSVQQATMKHFMDRVNCWRPSAERGE